jgi:membrane protein HdeD
VGSRTAATLRRRTPPPGLTSLPIGSDLARIWTRVRLGVSRCKVRRVNDAALTAIQTATFILAGGLSLRCLARESASLVRAILAAGLAAGGSMHVVMLIERGPIAASGQPLAFNVFWTSLAVADPLGALLLNVRPRAGILVTLTIMIADVSINLPASTHLGLFSPASWRLWVQTGYALFAMVAAPRIWAATAPPVRIRTAG